MKTSLILSLCLLSLPATAAPVCSFNQLIVHLSEVIPMAATRESAELVNLVKASYPKYNVRDKTPMLGQTGDVAGDTRKLIEILNRAEGHRSTLDSVMLARLEELRKNPKKTEYDKKFLSRQETSYSLYGSGAKSSQKRIAEACKLNFDPQGRRFSVKQFAPPVVIPPGLENKPIGIH